MQQLKWGGYEDPNIGPAKTGPTGPLATAMICILEKWFPLRGELQLLFRPY